MMVGIDVFKELDLRVARIVDIEDIEKARKPMYKLTLDVGAEIGTRVIAAGIKEVYSKEELLGKKIVCIVNLEPRNVAGVESQGMLLAAGEDSDIAILIPDKDILEGSQVH